MNPKYRFVYFVLGIITGIAFLTSGSISPIEEPITFFVAFFVIYTGGHLIDRGLQKLARLPVNRNGGDEMNQRDGLRCHDCDEALTDETVYYVKINDAPEQAYCDQGALWHTTGEPDHEGRLQSPTR